MCRLKGSGLGREGQDGCPPTLPWRGRVGSHAAKRPSPSGGG
ncbi:hypothetical protein BF49_4179 [Bradyrhizobium sp.]|nr:hypothetical protein BF49_4179 [Bradyrhizobium sp.]